MKPRFLILSAITGVSFGLLGLSAQEEEAKNNTSELERTLGGVADIELMKQGLTTDDTLQPGGSKDFIPTVTTEEPLSVSGLLPDNGNPERPREDEKWAAENWLLSGMRNLERGEELNGEQALDSAADSLAPKSRTDLWLEVAMNEVADQEDTDAAQSREDEADRIDDPLRTTNPLDQFMAGWLSPDSSQAGLSATFGDSAGLPSTGQTFDPAPAQGASVASLQELLVPQSANSSASIKEDENRTARTNPYADMLSAWTLETQNNSAAPVGLMGDFGGAAVLPAPQETFRPPPEISAEDKPSTRWVPPERNEEKYFPRLNRF
ncbi:MAG: hypothetical protein SynsKO_17370 [Synoicihabitans sp.]